MVNKPGLCVSDITANISIVTNTPFTRYSRLSDRLHNRFDKRFERTSTVRSTGCQTGLYNRIDNRLYRVYKHLMGCQTGLTNGCIV